MPTLVVVDRYFTVASIFSRTQSSVYTAQTVAKCTEFDPPLPPDLTITETRLDTILATIFGEKIKVSRTFQAPKKMDPDFNNFQESVAALRNGQNESRALSSSMTE